MERSEPHRFSPNPAISTLPSRKPTGILSSPLPLPMRRKQRIGSSSKGSMNCRSFLLARRNKTRSELDEAGSGAAGQACPPSRWRTSGQRGFSPHRKHHPRTVSAGCRHRLPAGDEGHRGSPGNSAMRGHDSRRAHAIPAPARFAAVSRLRSRDGAHPRDPAGRIPLRTTHLRVPRVQRCRYPSAPMKPLAVAPRFLRMPLVRTAARSPAG